MMIVQLLLVCLGWTAGWWLLWHVPLLRRSSAVPGARPAVSIVVPVRNERRRLPALLDSLVPQLGVDDELIIFDDHSTDGTAELVRARGLRVHPAPPLPPGWTGKSWACETGAGLARHDLLVFLDADVEVHPGALDAVVAFHADQGGLVSVQPYHRTERAYEGLSALFNVVSFMGVGAASPHRNGRAVGAFGPCLVCTSADYHAVGGHAAVRSEVVEDLALTRSFRAHDLPVSVRGGGALVSFRMYPEGPRQLVEGWTKNVATGAGTVPWGRTLAIAAWITGMLVTVQWGIESVVWGSGPGLAVVALAYLATVLHLRRSMAGLGDFGLRWALAYPVLVGAFVAVFARSLYRTTVRRSVTWRGRSVPVARAAQLEPAERGGSGS